MAHATQPSLPIVLGIRDLGNRAGARLLAIIRDVVRRSGKQESVARALGVSEALFSQALSGQRTFNVAWLPTILGFDHERKIMNYLGWESGCRVEVIEPLTKEQKFDRLIVELKRSGADVDALQRRAYAEPDGEEP